jgi:hypothetical protein
MPTKVEARGHRLQAKRNGGIEGAVSLSGLSASSTERSHARRGKSGSDCNGGGGSGGDCMSGFRGVRC